MKAFCVLCLTFCFYVPLFGYDPVPYFFPRKEPEPDGVVPEILHLSYYSSRGDRYFDTYEGEQLDQYAEWVQKKVRIFFDTLATAVTSKNKGLFLGQWILQDESGIRINKPPEEFDIIEKGGMLRYTYGPSFSYLRYSANNEFYINRSDNWDYGILQQLKILNGRLYIYVLVCDKWMLDPIHEDGKYFYVKYPVREVLIP
jgi:hypothetical protein